MKRGSVLTAAIVACCCAAPVAAQSGECDTDQVRLRIRDLSSARYDAARLLEVTGVLPAENAMVRRPSSIGPRHACRGDAPDLLWSFGTETWRLGEFEIEPLSPELRMEYRSAYPRDRNNGALRGGVGASSRLSAGVAGRWRWISAAVAPELLRHANDDFEIFPLQPGADNVFAHPWDKMDAPQRFGSEPSTEVRLGQSYLRADAGAFGVGLSSENVTIGPARIYPILMSTTAPSFPHVFLGTNRPVDIWIGRLEAHAIWGKLQESEYFDSDPSNDERFFGGLVIGYSPAGLDGLTFGVARVVHDRWDRSRSLGDWITSLYSTPTLLSGGNSPETNALGAVYAHYVITDGGIELWVEWGRDDTFVNLQEAITEPDYSRLYSLGFQKVARVRRGSLRIYGEHASLTQGSSSRVGKAFQTPYTHGTIIQGHTHEGQLLGAAIGGGSNNQLIGLDWFHDAGMVGLDFERIAHDENAYFIRYARHFAESRHDIEMIWTLRGQYAWKDFVAGAALGYARRWDRDFIRVEERAPRDFENNWSMDLQVEWVP